MGFFILFIYVCVTVWTYANVRVRNIEEKKRVLGLLELELSVVVSHLTWVLEATLWSPGRKAASTPSHGASLQSQPIGPVHHLEDLP